MIDALLLSITILLILAAIAALVFKRKTLAIYIFTGTLGVNLAYELLVQHDLFATIAILSYVGLVLFFAWKNDIRVLIKALSAASLAAILFHKSLTTFAIFTGIMFLISLTPKSKEETLPKKANITLSVLLIVIATIMTVLSIFGQANISLALSAYATLTVILIWDICREIKATP